MNKKKILVAGLAGALLPLAAWADWWKIDPPPDAEKSVYDYSCWLATAANMLAGAGYGQSGASMQTRACDIYEQLKLQFAHDQT